MGAEAPLIMISFWPAFGLAFIATTLLTSAAGHMARFSSFRDLIRDHAIVPPRGAAPAALLTLLAEAMTGVGAAILLFTGIASPATALLFVTTGLLGIGFLLYIRRLLRNPATTAGCGCTPLPSPLTPASQIPSAALVAVSAAGLASAAMSVWTAAAESGGMSSPSVLASLWGATVAVLVMLAPASMPAAVSDGRP